MEKWCSLALFLVIVAAAVCTCCRVTFRPRAGSARNKETDRCLRFLGSKEVDLTSVLMDDGRNAPKRLPFVASSCTAVHGGGVIREVFPKLLLQPFRVDIAEDPSIFD